MGGLVHGLRYTWRQLRGSCTFTLVSILIIALGIGANTAVFTVLNAVLLRYLPVGHPEELVYFHLKNQPLKTSETGWDDTSLSMPVFEAMRTRRDIFKDVVGFAPLGFEKVAVRIGAEPEEAQGEMVSGNFFSALEVQPFLGRGFTPEDESTHAPVAVLNYWWWKSRFSATANILGKTMYVKSVPFTIVGVAPPRFSGANPAHPRMDFWIPLQNRPELNPWGNAPGDETLYGSPAWLALIMLGRLQPGMSPKQAQAQLTPEFQNVMASTAPPDPHEEKPLLILSEIRGLEHLRKDYEHPLHVLMAMVALVLLIACANVVMLQLARNAGRLLEFCLRQALGADRRALFLSCLQESLLLVAAGAALGWFFAGSATRALTTWSGLDLAVAPDRRVLVFTTVVSALVAIGFGLAQMPFLARLPLYLSSRSSIGAPADVRNGLWGRKLIVALEVCLCVVLLCAAGLMYRTLRNLQSSNLGMRTAGLLVFGVSPQSEIHTDGDAVRFHTTMLARMRSLPAVDSATLMQVRIGGGGSDNNAVLVDGHNPVPEKRFAGLRYNSVGSEFLRTLGIPLQLGRDLADSDTSDSPKVAVVNQAFVDLYLPRVFPLGHHIQFLGETGEYTIVGVAGNSRYTSVRETPRPMAYIPFTQTTGVLGMQYELHTSGNPEALIPQAARLVHAIDPALPLHKPITQREQFAESIAQERLISNLSLFFGILAAILVAMGLYGAVSASVKRRTLEIGVRMALGAQRKTVLGMILRESLSVTLAGVAVGLPASLLVARALRSMLFGLRPGDPATVLFALLGIALVTLAAAFFPARRAASIDPIRALRMD